MEVASCIKAFVVAARQYQNNTNEANTVNMQRQLDVLITVTARTNQLKCFGARQMLPTECLTCVADILNDRDTKRAVVHKCLVLLNNLAQDEEIREMLHNVFEFTPILASLLIPSRGLFSDPLASDCLSLLQQITYGQRIPLHESHIEDLINFVLKKIQDPDAVLARRALGLLANLCRNNEPVQAFVKNQEKVRSLYRCLISYLSHDNPPMIILSLSVITSLCLHEELGEKLYHSNNINKTFQLIMNILINGICVRSRPYAVDLVLDIIKITSIRESLLVFDHLSMFLEETLKLILNGTPESLFKIFELLVALCGVAELRRKLCGSVLSSPPSPVFLAVVEMARQSVDTHTCTALLALDFLRELWEELVFAGAADTVSSHLDQMLPMLTETLMAPIDSQGATLKKKCQKIVKTIEILLALSEENGLRERVSESVDTTSLLRHIDFQFNNNHIAVSASRVQSDQNHWNEAGVDVVLFSLKLMFRLRNHVNNMDNYLVQTLQDARVVPFLADGLTSDIRSHVQVAVGLLRTASSLNGFPETILADCVAANNSRRSEQRSVPPSSVAPRPVMTSLADKENVPRGGRVDALGSGKSRRPLTQDQEASIQSLIDKMQMGLDVKELKPSEMISVYEQKIQSLQTREHQLEDMLEAKTLALTQADALLSQHRSRRAQSENELSRMRCLVQESEQRSEDYRDQVTALKLEHEKLQAEHEELLQENRRLEAVEEEYTEISSLHTEQTQKLEKTLKSLASLKKEHTALSEMHMMLQRHNESLKEQHCTATQQVAELEEQLKVLLKQFKEKESKLNELSKSYHKLDEKYTSAYNEKNELETAIDKYRTNLASQETAKKHLQHQVTTLELLCQQHETAIQEKDSLIQTQKVELDKHAQIAALIHNLSSGKGADQK